MLYIFFLLFVPLFCLYFYKRIKRLVRAFLGELTSRKARITTFAAALVLSLFIIDLQGFGTIGILHFLVFDSALSLFAFVLLKIPGVQKSRAVFVVKKTTATMLLPLVLTVSLLIYGYFNMNNVLKTEYTVTTSKSISAEGYKIGLMADIHFGISLDIEEFREMCEEISNEDVDIMFLVGDIVDDNTSGAEMKAAFSALSQIKTRYGIYYVYGNHDRQRYSFDKAYTEEELYEAITSVGITVLRDGVAQPTDELVIVGREDRSDKSRKPLTELLSGINTAENLTIVLDHQPSDYDKNARLGTDLLLSGHTHGGQIWPANLLLDIVKFNDGNYGVYKLGNDGHAVVTSGFAGWGFPVKTAAPAEYVIINVKK